MPPPAQPSGAVGSPSLRKEPVKELTAQGDPSGGSTMTWGPQEQGWGVPGCSPKDFQESSPTSQFKSINSLALSLLHSPTLTR